MLTFQLHIVTPERQALSEAVNSVSVPALDGRITVLPRHISLFAALTEGEVIVRNGSTDKTLVIGGGFLEITKKEVTILVSRALHAHELNESEIVRAEAHAKEVLAKAPKGLERAQALSILHRSLIETRILRKRQQH